MDACPAGAARGRAADGGARPYAPPPAPPPTAAAAAPAAAAGWPLAAAAATSAPAASAAGAVGRSKAHGRLGPGSRHRQRAPARLAGPIRSPHAYGVSVTRWSITGEAVNTYEHHACVLCALRRVASWLLPGSSRVRTWIKTRLLTCGQLALGQRRQHQHGVKVRLRAGLPGWTRTHTHTHAKRCGACRGRQARWWGAGGVFRQRRTGAARAGCAKEGVRQALRGPARLTGRFRKCGCTITGRPAASSRSVTCASSDAHSPLMVRKSCGVCRPEYSISLSTVRRDTEANFDRAEQGRAGQGRARGGE